VKIVEVNNNKIAFNEEHNIIIREYYLYCLSVLVEWLSNKDLNLNIIFGDYSIDFGNNNKVVKLDIQCEHTLVKPGGRSISEFIYGNTKYDNGTYLIRIDNRPYYESIDYVIDYSLANLFNISSNNIFDRYLKKVAYISPIIYENTFFDKTNRTDIITMFVDPHNHRRNIILDNLKNEQITITKVDNCYSKEDLKNIYSKTKVLINVHQTDYHHTFEELRVLPALVNGVLVVSEDVPLKEKIPYSNFIIWSKYEDLASTTKTVLSNYDKIHKDIFLNSNLNKIIETMRLNNANSFNGIINK
jgi:hypothetical protein